MSLAGTDRRRGETGFRLDLNLCTGCSACELACSTENRLAWGHSWRQVLTFNQAKIPSISTYHLSLACNHCADAPCLQACPALAIERDRRTGAVLIRPDLCIGCRYCSWACPFDAPRFDSEAQVMTKCTWCHPRLADGRDPACVEQCPTRALTFGSQPGVTLVPGFPDTDAQPAIRFTPLDPQREAGPECSWQVPAEVIDSFAASRPDTDNPISLRSEWPLWIFTLLASCLVGWVLASIAGLERPEPLRFAAAVGVAAFTSSLHLGNKLRAWRAVLNLRSSWLSREIVFFSLFVGLSLLHSAVSEVSLPGLLAGVFGLLTLFSIDRVYDFVRRPTGSRVHSADTVLTGLLAAALLLGETPFALLLLIIKLALYVGRHTAAAPPGMPQAAWISWVLRGFRFGLGIILPILYWMLGFTGSSWIPLAAIALGEMLDRAEFYSELQARSPRLQIASDLLARTTSGVRTGIG